MMLAAKKLYRTVAQRALGKPLPSGAEVHHVDRNRSNNSTSNLVICQDHAYHMLLHARQRVLDVGGNPNTQRICLTCKQLKTADELSSGRLGPDRNQCKACHNAACNKRRSKGIRKRGVRRQVEFVQKAGTSGHNAHKTHCKNGHAFEGDNLIVVSRRHGDNYRTVRKCRACLAATMRVVNAKARAKHKGIANLTNLERSALGLAPAPAKEGTQP